MTTTQLQAIVIGYGNTSRTDDAVGHHVIDALETMLPPATRPTLLKTCQLDVTLTETIASRGLVIFVDATVDSDADDPVCVRPIAAEPGPPSQPTSHALTPGDLLTLTRWLYGREPRAMLVTVRGHNFSFGQGLSAPARDAVPVAAGTVLELLNVSERESMR